ncbi:MAG: efflux RND transporter permease subunit [Wenzhouxiangellaceae bacterium]
MSSMLAALQRPRLILAAVILLALIGAAAWQSMNRQEDPSLPFRFGDLLVSWPGAQPEQVERLVLNILEEEVAQVEDVKTIEGLARLGFARVWIEMHEHIYDTDTVWDRIRNAAERAQRKFPAEAGPIEVRDKSFDPIGIVLAVSGSDDLRELLTAARQLRRDLFRFSDIARIEIIADPGEQVIVQLDPARAAELGVTPASLAEQLAARNQSAAGGSLVLGDKNLVLSPQTEFRDIEELASTPIRTASDGLLPLSELAAVSIGVEEPPRERFWLDGQPAVALGVVIPDDRLNAVDFGRRIRSLLEELRPEFAPLQIHEVYFQPTWVEQRLAELGQSLLIGVLIVAVILFVLMGPRLGLVVSILLPLVTFSGLAIFAIGGGVLHQMSVAGMVIAIGMLVDNAIVMIENLQWHLDQGKEKMAAAVAAVQELAGPLATATGTTLAAFMPLLLAPGKTPDFTRSIPVMVMLILVVSYFYAIFVTPVLGAGILRPGKQSEESRLQRFGVRLGHGVITRPLLVLLLAALMIAAAVAVRPYLKMDFFPDTDRNQMVVDLTFPEGTRLETTALKAGALAADISQLDGVTSVNHIVGTSGPRFYYNLVEMPRAPHLARVVVITESESNLSGILHWVRDNAQSAFPEAQIVARRLGQGPPVVAPVEIRLYGRQPQSLALAADQVMAALRQIPGAVDVRHRIGSGIPSLMFDIDDAEAARHGIARQQIADTLAGATLGRPISTWRAGREPFPIVLRTPEGEHLSTDALEGLMITTAAGENLPLAQFVTSRLQYQPAIIEHRNMQRMTAVLAQTAEGVTYSQVLRDFQQQFDAATLPAGVKLEIGGTAAEAGTANSAVFRSLPIGLLMLLGFLLWQFNSFRLVAIVLVTVPLAVVGVIPGLILAGQSFSFTATLGVIALIGIVVNNAIVLIDVIESGRAQGLTMEEAIAAAVGRRIRPILLTTATTVAGLLPLTFTRSTMWPPLAWAIISGLLASTVLTLMVIPVLYRLLMNIGSWRRIPANAR